LVIGSRADTARSEPSADIKIDLWNRHMTNNDVLLCWGKLPRVPWAIGYGPKLQDTTGSLQRHMAREPHTPYQEVTLPLQAEETGPPN
jgi:hypothetical protein